MDDDLEAMLESVMRSRAAHELAKAREAVAFLQSHGFEVNYAPQDPHEESHGQGCFQRFSGACECTCGLGDRLAASEEERPHAL